MIRAAHPHEIRRLPQIENAATGGMRGPAAARRRHAGAFDRRSRRRPPSLQWVAVSPLGLVVGFAQMKIERSVAWIEQLSVLDRWQGRGLDTALIDRCAASAQALMKR